jgi:hypothetical protein
LYATPDTLTFEKYDLRLASNFDDCSAVIENSYGIGIAQGSIDEKIFLAGAPLFAADIMEAWGFFNVGMATRRRAPRDHLQQECVPTSPSPNSALNNTREDAAKYKLGHESRDLQRRRSSQRLSTSLKMRTFLMEIFARFSCYEPFSIDLTLRFGEHRNGKSLASVRENLCQHLDVGARFMQAVS